MALNSATQSYVDFLVQSHQAYYQDMQLYRRYANGEQAAQLTNDQKILLVGEDGSGNPNAAPDIAINICGTVLDVETDRLEVRGFQVIVEDNEELSDTITQLVWQRWKQSRMDEGQQNVHYTTARDGNSYLFVYWDPKTGMGRFAFNRAYDGDSSGADMFYQDDDASQPICAVKVWTVQRPIIGNGSTGRVQRKNVYYEDRVEKYIRGQVGSALGHAQWRPLAQGDPDWEDTLEFVTLLDVFGTPYQATVAWWTDTLTNTGQPLGIPAAHFRHGARGEAYGRSAIADIAPGMQDMINMTGASLLAATVLSGFKVTWANKFLPQSTTLAVYPGAILYNEEDGTFGQLQETNLLQLVEVLNTHIKNAATLTSTPLTFFNQTGQMPAEGTQKQLELGLLAKTRRNQTGYGNAYEDAIRMLLKLESLFGADVTLTLEQIDALQITCDWEPAQMRNEKEETEIAQMHEALGVPKEFIWRRLGYTVDEIEEFQSTTELKQNQAMGQLAVMIAEQEVQNAQANVGTNPGNQTAIPANGTGQPGSAGP